MIRMKCSECGFEGCEPEAFLDDGSYCMGCVWDALNAHYPSDGEPPKVFVLCEDTAATLHSQAYPTGKAVRDEEAAREWVKQGTPGYTREYYKVTVVEDLD